MKILIVKTSSLGDIVHAFGALDYLRVRFPQAQIDWVAESACAELVKAHPSLNTVLVIESKKWRKELFKKESLHQMGVFRKKLRQTHYDLLFDLQGNVKSGLITRSAIAKKKIGFGWKTVSEWPNGLFTNFKINPFRGKNIREDYLAVVQGYFKDSLAYTPKPISLKIDPLQQQKLSSLFSQQPYPTLVCPSAAWPNKSLSEESLITVLTQLDHRPYWFIWGNSHEREVALRLSSHFSGSFVLEKLSLPLLQQIMARCKLIIAMDSLPLHLCGTTSTPTLSFFGPSSALKYKPLGERHSAIEGECPYQIYFEKRCPKLRSCATGLCLKSNELIERSGEEIRAHCQLNSSYRT